MHSPNLVTVSCCLLHATLTLVASLSPENVEELLTIHNFYRRVVASTSPPHSVANMNELIWSSSLALEAAQSVTCLSWRQRNATAAHDAARSINVGRRRRGQGVLTQIIRRWYQERVWFLRDEGACLPWDSCNQFRNLVNAKHRTMGCAAAMTCGRQRNILVLMCLYQGGITEEFGFNHGTPCTGCSGSSSFCNVNLCVSCNPALERCECRKTCHGEGVGYGVLHQANCTCSCSFGHGPNCDQPCQNVQQFVDYDVCSVVSRDDCDDASMGSAYREFCPAVCSCRPLPDDAGSSSLVVGGG